MRCHPLWGWHPHSVPRLPKNGKNLSFIWKRSSENGWWCIGYVIWLFFWLIIFIFLNSYLLGLGLNYVIMAYWAKSLFWIIAQLKIIYWKWLWAWWKHILLHFIKKKFNRNLKFRGSQAKWSYHDVFRPNHCFGHISAKKSSLRVVDTSLEAELNSHTEKIK